jgi:hypothetical protein
MMVVSAIFLILSSIILAKHSSFGSTIVLESLAHDIALSIREAQIYGIAVRRCDTSDLTTACTGDDRFASGYGMYFNLASPSEYVLFADIDGDGTFDPGETVKTTTIAGGYFITDLCVRSSGVSEDDCTPTTLYTAFERPEPDALIRHGSVSTPDRRGIIVIESNRGERASVVVENSGQISVQSYE